MSFIAKRLGIMHRRLFVCLFLCSGLFSSAQAENSQFAQIMGPDGRNKLRAAPLPSGPSLEEQLRRRQKQEQETSIDSRIPTEPATPTEDLIDPKDRTSVEHLDRQAVIPEGIPWFRMSLGLAPARGQRMSGSIKTWRYDPGLVFENSWRLSDQKKPLSFWFGWRMAAWNGTAASDQTFARFSVLYFGPLFAFSWSPATDADGLRSLSRQSFAFGLAGVSRQADPNFPGQHKFTQTRPMALEGPGLWLAYGFAYRITQGFEWETKLGLQSGASSLITYASFGVNLWSD